MLRFRGSTQEKCHFYFSRFGYGIASNDKKVPDRVGSGCKGILLMLLILLVIASCLNSAAQGVFITNTAR